MIYFKRQKNKKLCKGRETKRMLALSRKVGETIVIDNNIEIVVLDVKGEQVKIGINAPKTVPIYRKEIYDQIQEANKEAMESY